MSTTSPASSDPGDDAAAASVDRLADELAGQLTVLLATRPDRPLVVALDGRSGSGKSTLAAGLAQRTDVGVIPGDDFYAGGTAEEWDRRSAREKADGCIDWRRQRRVLLDVRRGAPARWRSFDWDAFDGRLRDEEQVCGPAPLVVLEGAYSARPALADLVDVRVLLDTPPAIRRRQLLQREGDAYRSEWEARWGEAEDFYFGTVVPADGFDLVLVP